MRRTPLLALSLGIVACGSTTADGTELAAAPADAAVLDAAPPNDAAHDGDALPDTAFADVADALADGSDAPSDSPSDADDAAPGETVVWPLSASPAKDADTIRAPYGPRWIGRYDFHAGIDLPAKTGTAVHAVMDGEVIGAGDWDGASVGAGTWALVKHTGNRFTAYLHLSKRSASKGTKLAAGDELGEVGETGATYPHLHFTYFVGLTGTSSDERKSRNPLELLPHGEPEPPVVKTWGAEVVIDVPLQRMKVRRVRLLGAAASAERSLDYYAVVAKGSSARDAHVHFGTWIGAGAAKDGKFPLTLAPDPKDFTPTRVVLEGFDGATLLDASKP